jgi:hypothetical protein
MRKISTTLILTILFVSCQARKDTLFIISSVKDVSGYELTMPIEIKINGNQHSWSPGRELILNIPIYKEQSVNIELISDDLILVSPNQYIVEQNTGIELSLVVRRESIAVDDTIQPIDEPQNSEDLSVAEPQKNGQLVFSTIPSNAQLVIRDASTGQVVYNSDSENHNVDLTPGNYTWSLTLADYQNESGSISIISNQTINRSVTLNEVIKFGSLNIQISPSSADVIVRNTTTSETINNASTGVIDIPIGSYEITATAEGYNTFRANFTVDENRETLVVKGLESANVIQIVSNINRVNNITQALLQYQNLPADPLTNITIQQRVEYYSALLKLAQTLYRNGENLNGINLLKKIVSEDPNKVDARIELATLLIANSEFEESRVVARPIFGPALNTVATGDREVVSLSARYLIAFSLFEEFNQVSESNFSRRNELGGQTYSSLQDFISRYESSRASNVQNIRSMYLNAVNFRNIVGAELGL